MLQFIRGLLGRFRGVDGGLDFEARLIARDAERKAVLLRRAARYEEEGLHHVAEQMRQRAEAINFERPLASLLSIGSKEVTATSGNGQSRLPLAKRAK